MYLHMALKLKLIKFINEGRQRASRPQCALMSRLPSLSTYGDAMRNISYIRDGGNNVGIRRRRGAACVCVAYMLIKAI